MPIPKSLPFHDSRQFALYDYRHGHSYLLIRGFPWQRGGHFGPVVDLAFRWVVRVACRRDFSPLALRYATDAESAALQERIGRLKPRQKVYLLEPGTVESYVVAGELVVAEYSIGGGAESPLVSADPAYVADNPPRRPPVTF